MELPSLNMSQRRWTGLWRGRAPPAGHYRSKSDFRAHTFEKLNEILPHGTQLHVEHALTSADWVVLELHSLAIARNGPGFDNRY
jgi:uncharacterized protein